LANVLYVAAHPDDENTRMISYLSNHLAVNTTYLSLTRGDGGQNLIGPEIREMLGLIRTKNWGARDIDGGISFLPGLTTLDIPRPGRNLQHLGP
jgi:hypothetical protein